jgi:methionyl-tRNA synthetase
VSEKILVCTAWPYANGNLHLGHIAGAYLPADIFARYHRMKGNAVLMVSGSDTHGTPITVTADKRGITPREVVDENHRGFLDIWEKFGISYNLFTHTDTENHQKVSQDIFLQLKKNGYLFTARQEQMYSETSKRFLPDRYVEGACPKCGYESARGDQCDKCGSLLEASELINPKSQIDGSTPVLRETEHFFLDLPKFSDRLKEYLETKTFWRGNVMNFVRNYLKQGLHPRPITRDIGWGIPVPLEGFQDKRLYVWFEAVIGYFSASIEHARAMGQPQLWKEWWYSGDAKTYYFIGKDNIPFHAIIWPAQLMGVENLYEEDPEKRLNLPWDIPANEFLNLEGGKFSTSLNWAVWMPDYLENFDPDPLRYYLTANAPEQRDTEFTWADFIARNNNELVATWGNLANRALSFTRKHFEGKIPEPGQLDGVDSALLAKIEAGFEPVGRLLSDCKIKAALTEVMALAREVNRYFDEKAPWTTIKQDKERTGTTMYTALQAIDHLKTMLAPFLPFTCQQLHEMLGAENRLFGQVKVEQRQEKEKSHECLVYDGSEESGRWEPVPLPAGRALGQVKPLFIKLEGSIADEEKSKLGDKS